MPHSTLIGIAITAVTAAVLVGASLRRKRYPFPAYGLVGLAVLVLAELMMLRHIWPVDVYFTPIAWTAYLLISDALVLSIRGRSRLHDEPRHFLGVALLSLPLWLVFEAYNLRLANWTYVGVPMSWPAALLGYCWSFATITPAIFETADLVAALGWFRPATPLRFSQSAHWFMMVLGAAFLLVPLVIPQHLAAYLFGLVWAGFVLLLDPINQLLGLPSLLADLAQGRREWLWSLVAAGWVCGWFWEFWNYWAGAKWHYIFPMFQDWKIFEMPAPGYLGFLPFALECFVMYVSAIGLLRTFPMLRSRQERTAR